MLLQFMLISVWSVSAALGAFVTSTVQTAVQSSDRRPPLCAIPSLREKNKPLEQSQFTWLTQEHLQLPVEKMSPEEEFSLRNKWAENQTQLGILFQDSEELKRLHVALHQDTGEYKGYSFLKKARKTSKRLKKVTSIFKQLKLLELGGLEPKFSNFKNLEALLKQSKEDAEMIKKLPPQAFPFIAKHSWRKLGKSCVNELEELIVQYSYSYISDIHHRVNHKGGCTVFLPYAFKTIDFFFKNNFVNQETVKNLFQKQEILRMTANYNFDYFVPNIPYGINELTTDCNKLWFWPLRLSIFKEMSEKDERRMNFETLHQKLIQLLSYNYFNLGINECRNIHESLLSRKYLDQFKYIEEPKESILSPVPNGQVASKNYNYTELEEDYKSLLELMLKLEAMESDESEKGKFREFLRLHVYWLLEFIEEEFCPGIMKQTTERWFKSIENFEDQICLEGTSLKIDDLQLLVKGYQIFTKDSKNIQKYPQINKEFTHKYFHDRAINIYSEYLKICSRLESKNDSWYLSMGNDYSYPRLDDGGKLFLKYLDDDFDYEDTKGFWSN
ncbi:hypothetical protein PGT21_023811 [Puccinia graminis f. sp. tritici]|uniref:Uncharacterized protein n=1 Tax=Puccinia graminis f. sp. tritici TaxID=56615 RepID=A0A5B0M7W7_PUCGR|nr:hypothetical protein PGTUg99_020477 [Puccinia graminis f. sp. tritici]KAA1071954.1 hypothetical protein PGT21_023811 [Puccinia graminis f. sp. tritici]